MSAPRLPPDVPPAEHDPEPPARWLGVAFIALIVAVCGAVVFGFGRVVGWW